MDAININTIIDKKILIRSESIDILNPFNILGGYFSLIRLYNFTPNIKRMEKTTIPITP